MSFYSSTFATKLFSTHKIALPSAKEYTAVNGAVDPQSLSFLPQIPNLTLVKLEKVARKGRIIKLFFRYQIPSITCSGNHWHNSFRLILNYAFDFSLCEHPSELFFMDVFEVNTLLFSGQNITC